MSWQIQNWPTPEIFARVMASMGMKTAVINGGSADNVLVSVPHGLGAVPNLVQIFLKCIANDAGTGLVVGQYLDAQDIFDVESTVNWSSTTFDAVNLYWNTMDGTGDTTRAIMQGGGDYGTVSFSNFDVIFVAVLF